MKDLAIIIPAYKDTFLDEALKSIALQTCNNFTLYIGDDHSPYDIKSIVDKYYDQIDLVYKRFDNNLGGKDLVAQWERCIDMNKGEQWIWLFSDDDVMESTCVENFYKHLHETDSFYDLYHFNVKRINDKGDVIDIPRLYPQVIYNFDFYRGKMTSKYASLVVENIFSRNIYEQCNGFKKFDLAWGSDTATWVMFSADKGLYTIPDSYVLWRVSDQNISPNMSESIAFRKIKALLSFFLWSKNYFNDKKVKCFFVNVRAFISRMRVFMGHVNSVIMNKTVGDFCSSYKCKALKPIVLFLIKCRL